MARIRAIRSNRSLTDWPTWQMVHEWEDVFASRLGAEISPLTRACLHPDPGYVTGDHDLFFLPLGDELEHYRGNPQLIPVVLDLWRKDLPQFQQLITSFRLIFITSMEIYREIDASGCGNVAYLPFSVPERYLRDSVPAKDIDVIQFGRRNPVLDEYMAAFLGERPEIEYVTTFDRDDRVWFHSNQRGVMGPSDSRSRFMKILGRSRISLVSTVGMDGVRDTGGVNPLSPRFYESAASFCHIIGRFPKNEEFVLLGAEAICDRVAGYEEFASILTDRLAQPFNRYDEYLAFLEGHTTERRAEMAAQRVSNLDGMRNRLVRY